MKAPPSSQYGFTLVEMLVVLVLLGMTAAISLPYVSGSARHQKLDSTAMQLAALFRKAQSQAYVTNAVVEVTFDRESRTWHSASAARLLQVDPSITVTVLSIEGQVSDSTFGFRFLPTGGNTGGQVVLTSGGRSVDVKLNWLTGAVTSGPGNANP
jgi:general secretion pathway protein H